MVIIEKLETWIKNRKDNRNQSQSHCGGKLLILFSEFIPTS